MRTIKDVDLKGKRVLLRADLNVPLEDGAIVGDLRLREALPTIEHLRAHGARVILCSHLGRPEGHVREELRLGPVAQRLSELLGAEVLALDDCVGEQVERAVRSAKPGQVILLENLRFHPGETANDGDFARQLAALADVYVGDAFAAAHRAHASIEAVAHHLPAVAGLLLEREIESLEPTRDHPERPFAILIGGARLGDKIGLIDRFVGQMDHLLVGGCPANTLLKATGLEVGRSLVDESSLGEARRILDEAREVLVLPVDLVIASAATDLERDTVKITEVPPDRRILDIGPATINLYRQRLQQARAVLWSGPPGAFEHGPFSIGSHAMARILADLDATTLVGGGDTARAVEQTGMMDAINHVSTGGAAFLEYMEGKDLPGLRVLSQENVPQER